MLCTELTDASECSNGDDGGVAAVVVVTLEPEKRQAFFTAGVKKNNNSRYFDRILKLEIVIVLPSKLSI